MKFVQPPVGENWNTVLSQRPFACELKPGFYGHRKDPSCNSFTRCNTENSRLSRSVFACAPRCQRPSPNSPPSKHSEHQHNNAAESFCVRPRQIFFKSAVRRNLLPKILWTWS